MKIIRTSVFDKQVDDLIASYRYIITDVDNFLQNPLIHKVTDLWNGLIKCRYKNSSIPCGKSWGLRFLWIVSGSCFIPVFVYSKRHYANPPGKELDLALKKIFGELNLSGAVKSFT